MASNSGMELNKIAAAVLLAGLIGMVVGKATEFLYEGGPEHPGHHEEEARGYSIEVVETSAGVAGSAEPEGAPDIAALMASADAAKGAEYFSKKCAVCHDASAGGPNKVGPNLHGVMGRKIASHAGFNYSEGLKAKSGESWNVENMNQFQYNPRKWAPGTIMAFAGNKKDAERANLIAYLQSLK